MKPRLGLGLALALGMGASAAGAQEPVDSVSREPPADSVQVSPPPARTAPRLSLVLSLGSAGIGELGARSYEATVGSLRTGPPWVARDTATIRRALVTDGGFHAGLSVVLSLSPTWAARLGGGVARTTLLEDPRGDDDPLLETARALWGGRETDLQLLTAEAAVRYRVGSTRRVQPYLELGAVASRWSTDAPLPGAPGLPDGVTRFGAMAALGGVLPLGDRLSVTLHASTRAVGTPLEADADTEEAEPRLALVLRGLDEAGTAFADPHREVLGATRLEIGLSLDLGRVGDPPPDRSGSPGSM